MSRSKDKLLYLMIYQMIKAQSPSLTRPLRIRATLWYVKGIKAARASALALLGLLVLHIVLFTGFLLFHVGLFFYLPWEVADKGLLLMGLGGGYILIILIICAFCLSQRRWMKKTGADTAILKALK